MLECATLDRYIIIKRHINTIIYASLDNLNEYLEYTFDNNEVFEYEIMEKMNHYKFQEILNEYYSFTSQEEQENELVGI